MKSCTRRFAALVGIGFFAFLLGSLRAEFAYVTNVGNGNISAFRINPTTGALTPVHGSPFPTGNSPFFVVVDLLGRFVYVTNSGDMNISGYRMGENGALTPVPGSPFPAGASAYSPRVDLLGRFVYAANAGNGGNDSVSAFRINPTTGALFPRQLERSERSRQNKRPLDSRKHEDGPGKSEDKNEDATLSERPT